MPKTKISLKSIKAELEKLKTLDEKQQYLESVLKKIKGEKLKSKVQKLLDKTLKHLKHEAKLTEEISLEEKLASAKEAATEIPPGTFSDIKYTPKREAISSPLEKEVEKTPFFGPPTATIGIKYTPPSEMYEHQSMVESMRFYLSEQQQLVQKFNPETWQAMTEERRRQVFDVVKQSLGMSEITGAEDYGRVINYISDVFSTGKPGEKYKTALR